MRANTRKCDVRGCYFSHFAQMLLCGWLDISAPLPFSRCPHPLFGQFHTSPVSLCFPSLSPLLLCICPLRFTLATFLHCSQEAPLAPSAHSIPVSPFLFQPKKTLLYAVSTQSLPPPSSVRFSLRLLHAMTYTFVLSIHSPCALLTCIWTHLSEPQHTSTPLESIDTCFASNATNHGCLVVCTSECQKYTEQTRTPPVTFTHAWAILPSLPEIESIAPFSAPTTAPRKLSTATKNCLPFHR